MAEMGDVGGLGAYGLALTDVPPEAARYLGPAPASWEPWAITRRDWDGGRIEEEWLWPSRATLRVSGNGWLDMDGQTRSAVLHVPTGSSDAALVHPYLSLIAAMAAYWRGWDYLHAGGIVVDGGVWGVFGERGAGKTSTLTRLSQRDGVEVLTDDVLILDAERTAYAGPRCTDLRADAAERMGQGRDIGVVGGRRRWRVTLGPVAPELPFRGWIQLAWEDRVSVTEPPPSARFQGLAANLALRLVPPDAAALLRLVDMPFVRLGRPRDFDRLDGALDELLAALTR